MKLNERIKAFSDLGRYLEQIDTAEFQSLATRARQENPWFTEESVRMAVSGIVKFLTPEELTRWTSHYTTEVPSKKVAVVMAGNLPLVGFHDFLSILISGHSILIKRSSKDTALVNYVVEKLIALEPRFAARIEFGEQLKGFDAIIATGSDNSSRYFDYYFSKYPNIIRKNRTSVAVINGNESEAELKDLATDVFSYFGLGCRNVSKLFVPVNYGLDKILRSWEPFQPIIHHHKYCNNYDYQKSILLVGGTPFLDNGFVMLQESPKLVSPISVVYYEYYDDRQTLNTRLDFVADKIQCIVENSPTSTLRFGQAQFPAVDDYADRVDTLKFLSALGK